jgi:hypothetical protein
MVDIKEELKVVGELDGVYFNNFSFGKAPKYNTPITPKENFLRFMKGKDYMWTPCSADFVTIMPSILPDNVSRAFVYDTQAFDILPTAKDMFGVEWEYVASAGGAMVRPGNPVLVPDICEWEKYVKFPDISSYDWEGARERFKNVVNDDRVVVSWVFNGLFERLISFMEFENAALALIDEDEQEYVHSLFSRLCDMYDELFDKLHTYLNVDIVYFHDDWGSQRAPFFSKAVADEMLVPYLKRVCDSLHKRGMFIDFHSCGQVEILVPAMIEAGVDIWSGQPMNDRKRIMTNYGDDIKLNLAPDMSYAMPSSPEEAAEFARKAEESNKAFINDYKPYMKSMVVSAMSAGNPKLYELVYAATREAYSK